MTRRCVLLCVLLWYSSTAFRPGLPPTGSLLHTRSGRSPAEMMKLAALAALAAAASALPAAPEGFPGWSPMFPETKIISPKWGTTLDEMMQQPTGTGPSPVPAGQVWKLCYSSDTMAKTVAEFHARCDPHNITLTVAHNSLGTSLSGPISTILTVLGWICAGMYMCGALPSPVCAQNWPISC